MVEIGRLLACATLVQNVTGFVVDTMKNNYLLYWLQFHAPDVAAGLQTALHRPCKNYISIRTLPIAARLSGSSTRTKHVSTLTLQDTTKEIQPAATTAVLPSRLKGNGRLLSFSRYCCAARRSNSNSHRLPHYRGVVFVTYVQVPRIGQKHLISMPRGSVSTPLQNRVGCVSCSCVIAHITQP